VEDKFGRNSGLLTGTAKQTLCEGCADLYTYSDVQVADIISVSSDNAGDNTTIEVEGADINGNLHKQDVVLNGTTRVALATPLWRVWRMQVKDINHTSGVAGVVYIYTGTTETAGVPPTAAEKGRITDGDNQTLMALYTIPLGKVGFLYRGELGVSDTSAGTDTCNLHYRSRRVASVFKTKKSIDCVAVGSSIFQDERTFPDPIPALTDIEITKIEASAAMGAWAAFDIMLVDEDQLPASYLDDIGQPSVMPDPPA
jgi:hypothetical protein